MADLDEIQRIYDIVDENADGMVSVDEMHGYHQANEEKDESEDLLEAFRSFDQNKDGTYISSDELQNVLSTMGLIAQRQDSQTCEEMICRFDSDCNGVWISSELKNMMSP
ncbi:hypothetical protein SUGI_0210250 [Cryptomeria japonica]|uniref:calmodulin-like protein 2 n=1 Tax=Cryptomeria japonica TaxID=3369 RepID=UPI002408C943|nr:calmodulin-like protein 2 [Cryptomeria japonica]GLJ13323.1 hypothetical protein SUGI_0210250 [Cryptomeria japonica]